VGVQLPLPPLQTKNAVMSAFLDQVVSAKKAETEIEVFWSPEDEVWIANHEDLEINAFGDTQPEALRELATAMELYREQEEVYPGIEDVFSDLT